MTDLKPKIRAHLAGAGEATAKQITAALNLKNYPTTVINALSEMRTDAEVECEKKKGKGNEMWYWLTDIGSRQAEPTAKESTGEPALDIALRNHNLITAIVSAAGFSPNANLDGLPGHIAELARAGDDLHAIVSANVKFCGFVGQLTEGKKHPINLFECQELLQELVDTAAAERSAARSATASQQKPSPDNTISLEDAARGYLVCAPKRKPAKFAKPESAIAKAKAAARATGSGEVFALVPVGRATRKTRTAVEFAVTQA